MSHEPRIDFPLRSVLAVDRQSRTR